MAKAKGGGNKGGAAASATTAATAPNLGQLLAAAVTAVQTNQPFYATKADMQPLISHPQGQLVEYNEGLKQGDKIGFRATALGMQANASGAFNAPQPSPAPGNTWPGPAPQGGTAPNAPAAAQTDGAAPKTFNFESNVPIPTARRGGRGQNTYGFEQMNVGQSFFIPKSDDNPNPGKRVASTVSGATKRYAPKAFIVRSVEGGARVWRTA